MLRQTWEEQSIGILIGKHLRRVSGQWTRRLARYEPVSYKLHRNKCRPLRDAERPDFEIGPEVKPFFRPKTGQPRTHSSRPVLFVASNSRRAPSRRSNTLGSGHIPRIPGRYCLLAPALDPGQVLEPG